MTAKWPEVALGEVLDHVARPVDVIADVEYRQIGIRSHGRGIFHKEPVTGLQLGEKRVFWVEPGDFVLNIVFAWEGAVAVVGSNDAGMIGSHRFPTFRADPPRLEAMFLLWYFRTPRGLELLGRVSPGGAGRNRTLSRAAFLEQSVPLPPLAEQRRIVAKIEHLAAKVEEARRLRRQAADEVSVLGRAVADRLYRTAAAKHGLTTVGELCESVTDGDHLTPPFAVEGVPFIFVGNVSTGSLHFEGCKYVTPEYFEKIGSARKPRRGDILYTAVGATLGVPAIVDCDREFCFQRHVAILRPDHARLLTSFLWHMLRSSIIYRKAWASTTGSAQPTISLRGIRALPIPSPSVQEQALIVEHLNRTHGMKVDLDHLQSGLSQKVEALIPAILDQALRGDL